MKRCRAVFLAAAALASSLIAFSTTAAEHPTAPSPAPAQPENPTPPPPPAFRIVPATTPVAAANTNESSLQPAEIDLRTQSRLLSALAQEHRQRAEAAAKSDQAQRAKWETDLADELASRSLNILAQLEESAAQKPAPVSASQTEPAVTLNPAESDYLAKIQERLQAVQQQIAAATQEATADALQSATNRDTVYYGDNSPSSRLQEIGRELKRLQTEQADLELKTSQFWALRALFRSAQVVPSPGTNRGAVGSPAP